MHVMANTAALDFQNLNSIICLAFYRSSLLTFRLPLLINLQTKVLPDFSLKASLMKEF